MAGISKTKKKQKKATTNLAKNCLSTPILNYIGEIRSVSPVAALLAPHDRFSRPCISSTPSTFLLPILPIIFRLSSPSQHSSQRWRGSTPNLRPPPPRQAHPTAPHPCYPQPSPPPQPSLHASVHAQPMPKPPRLATGASPPPNSLTFAPRVTLQHASDSRLYGLKKTLAPPPRSLFSPSTTSWL